MRGKNAITLPGRAHAQAIASIKRYFSEQMDEPIGDLKATLLIDFVLVELGPAIYNQAVAASRHYVEERAADLSDVCHHAEFPYWAKVRGQE